MTNAKRGIDYLGPMKGRYMLDLTHLNATYPPGTPVTWRRYSSGKPKPGKIAGKFQRLSDGQVVCRIDTSTDEHKSFGVVPLELIEFAEVDELRREVEAYYGGHR